MKLCPFQPAGSSFVIMKTRGQAAREQLQLLDLPEPVLAVVLAYAARGASWEERCASRCVWATRCDTMNPFLAGPPPAASPAARQAQLCQGNRAQAHLHAFSPGSQNAWLV